MDHWGEKSAGLSSYFVGEKIFAGVLGVIVFEF